MEEKKLPDGICKRCGCADIRNQINSTRDWKGREYLIIRGECRHCGNLVRWQKQI